MNGAFDRRHGLDHIERLEAESIGIIRDSAAAFENPVMLYSVGKDSSVLLELTRRAFAPGALPFPLLHIDTGWKFHDTITFRDRTANRLGLDMRVHTNPDGVAQGIGPITHGPRVHTEVMKTRALRQAIDQQGFDAAIGGARRDEDASRGRERIFSLRRRGHRWDPDNQRPEPWNLCNPYMAAGETMRIFPLSDWTEIDIWRYIQRHRIPVVPLYFAAKRPVVHRDGRLIVVDDDRLQTGSGEPTEMLVRFRTIGCWPLSGAIESTAATIDDIIRELECSTSTEREGRLISGNDGTIEQEKREGYF